jgi:hypothetical protein
MKQHIYFVGTVACVLLHMNLLYSADTNYTIEVYDDGRHHDEVFTFSASRKEHFVDFSPNQEEAQKHRARLDEKTHCSLRNNTPMNPMEQVERSFQRSLLHCQDKLIGVVSFYIRKDDGNCFIDSLDFF